MTCAHCRDRLGTDWVEWRERHTISLGNQAQLVTVHAAMLCPPPRACAGDYAETRNSEAHAVTLHHAPAEPF